MPHTHVNVHVKDEITPGDLTLLRLRAERAHKLEGSAKDDELENML